MGRTPLMTALSTKDSSKWVPIRGSCRNTVESLLSNGAQVNARSGRGLRPIHFAARQSLVDICTLLILRGADVTAKTEVSRRSCLHLAVLSGKLGVVSLLASLGAPLNARDNKGQTALYLAVREGFQSTVALLLELDANASIPSASGRTPLGLALRKGHFHTARILREFGAHDTVWPPKAPIYSPHPRRHTDDRLVDEDLLAELCIDGA